MVPMPPGFVNVNVAPVCSSTDELVVARFSDQIFVGRAERGEVERVGALDDRHDERARTVFALRVDRESEVDPGFDALRFAALAPERGAHPRLFFRGLHDRVRDEMRERNLLAAPGGFDRGVEFRAARLERADRERAKRRRRRNRRALVHVAGERCGRTFDLGDFRLRADRRICDGSAAVALGGTVRSGRLERSGGHRRVNVFAQNQSVGAGAFHAREIEPVAVGQTARVMRDGLREGTGSRAAFFRRRFGRPGRAVRRRRYERRLRAGGRFSGGSGGRIPGRFGRAGVDFNQHRTDGDRFAFRTVQRGDHAGGRRRYLDVDLIGGDVDDRFALVDPLTDLLAPLDDRAFGNGLAHFGQRYLN